MLEIFKTRFKLGFDRIVANIRMIKNSEQITQEIFDVRY